MAFSTGPALNATSNEGRNLRAALSADLSSAMGAGRRRAQIAFIAVMEE